MPKSFSQTKLFNPYVVNPEQMETLVSEERSQMGESRSKKFKITNKH
jgi:hypothetical protein